MRILIVTDVFPPEIGGPATFGERLALTLSESGHHVTVICATEKRDDKHERRYKVIRAGYSGNIVYRQLQIRYHLVWTMLKTDIVYCMGLEHQTDQISRLTRKPYVLRIGGDSVWEGARNLGVTNREPEEFYSIEGDSVHYHVTVPEQRRIRQLRSAVSIVFVSQYLKNLAQKWDPSLTTDSHVIVNGIADDDGIISITDRNNDEPLNLFFVGRQTNWKGVDLVLLAIKDLSNVQLTVAGSGPQLPANKDLCARLRISDRVNFIGHINPKDILSHMRHHHVLVLPSLYEGISNTLLEAGIAGLACISSNRGGNPEVIKNGKTGLLVDPFDKNELTESIRLLRDNEALRKELATAHNSHVHSAFSLNASLTETVKVLTEAAKRTHGN